MTNRSSDERAFPGPAGRGGHRRRLRRDQRGQVARRRGLGRAGRAEGRVRAQRRRAARPGGPVLAAADLPALRRAAQPRPGGAGPGREGGRRAGWCWPPARNSRPTTSCWPPGPATRSRPRATWTAPRTRTRRRSAPTRRWPPRPGCCWSGAGAVGIELAGEIKAVWPSKQVTLVDVADDVLGGPFRPELRAELRRQLAELGVQVLLGSPLRAEPPTEPGELADLHRGDAGRDRGHRRHLVPLLRRHPGQRLPGRRSRRGPRAGRAHRGRADAAGRGPGPGVRAGGRVHRRPQGGGRGGPAGRGRGREHPGADRGGIRRGRRRCSWPVRGRAARHRRADRAGGRLGPAARRRGPPPAGAWWPSSRAGT